VEVDLQHFKVGQQRPERRGNVDRYVTLVTDIEIV